MNVATVVLPIPTSEGHDQSVRLIAQALVRWQLAARVDRVPTASVYADVHDEMPGRQS